MKRRHIAWISAGAGLAAAIAVIRFGAGLSEPEIHADADDPEAVARGRVLYAEFCAACHGENLEGQADWRKRDAEGYLPAPPHDHTGHTWHHPDADLFAVTKRGTEAIVGGSYKSRMEGFGDRMSDAEILAVLAYIKSTWPAQIRARQESRNKPGN